MLAGYQLTAAGSRRLVPAVCLHVCLLSSHSAHAHLVPAAMYPTSAALSHPSPLPHRAAQQFTELVLLQRGGRLTYFGPLGNESSDLIAYLEGQPGVEPIK